jgi:methionyl aminopeptidase
VGHRKTPPRTGVSCSVDAPVATKQSLPDWAVYYEFTGSLRPCLYSPTPRPVPPHIRRPDYAHDLQGISKSEQLDRKSTVKNIPVYTTKELEDCTTVDAQGQTVVTPGLRHACRMGRQVLEVAARALRVGVTTDEIDRIVHDACIERDCYPSPLNYYNFPKSVCTSVNEVICHGIPDFREVQNGDIVNLDVTVYNRGGYHGDLNETFCVGNAVDDASRKLVQTAYECLAAALDLVKPGCLYRDLGTVIERHAKANGCSVNRTYCGHGIGSLFHTQPNIPHYHKNKAKGTMKVGHVFTIEPMINMGLNSPHDVTWDDHWTAATTDGKRSAQFEHTLIVTETGYELLTERANQPVMIWSADRFSRP